MELSLTDSRQSLKKGGSINVAITQKLLSFLKSFLISKCLFVLLLGLAKKRILFLPVLTYQCHITTFPRRRADKLNVIRK